MRSVLFHLIGATRQTVAERFPVLSHSHGGWYSGGDSLEHVLFLSFYNDFLTEAEPAELDELRSALGMLPTVTVTVDVSGRVPGKKEIREFAEFVLSEFRGVACDDYTSHCWTLSEIRAGTEMSGHKFFDYEG